MKIDFINGNAVIHFIGTLTEAEHKQCEQQAKENGDVFALDAKYRYAIRKAKPFRGRKFHNKKYGGGIAFDSEQECKKYVQFLNQ